MTHVKIEAHGHLGDFAREYFIEQGKELEELTKIFREFVVYVLNGREKLIVKVLGELAAIEAIEKEKERKISHKEH